jgi:hypothetical protein
VPACTNAAASTIIAIIAERIACLPANRSISL